eukprot:136241-Hanusia_phi.AAC.1
MGGSRQGGGERGLGKLGGAADDWNIADAIAAADEARNRMALDTSGNGSSEDIRPPSPKLEAEPGEERGEWRGRE